MRKQVPFGQTGMQCSRSVEAFQQASCNLFILPPKMHSCDLLVQKAFKEVMIQELVCDDSFTYPFC